MSNFRKFLIEQELKLDKIEVQGEELYLRDVTISQAAEISKRLEEKTSSEVEAIVDALIATACDASGTLLFTKADKDALLQMPVVVFNGLKDYVTAKFLGESIEDIKKN